MSGWRLANEIRQSFRSRHDIDRYFGAATIECLLCGLRFGAWRTWTEERKARARSLAQENRFFEFAHSALRHQLNNT